MKEIVAVLCKQLGEKEGIDYHICWTIRQPPIFRGENIGFELLQVYGMTPPLMVEGTLMVRDSITADPQYEGLTWLFVPSLEPRYLLIYARHALLRRARKTKTM